MFSRSKRFALLAHILAFAVTFAAAAPAFAAPSSPKVNLLLNFTVGLKGKRVVFPAMLTWTKGALTGQMVVTYEGVNYTCVVLAGSTDLAGRLKMTCSVEDGVDIITLDGILKVKAGNGRGRFLDTYLNLDTLYTVEKAGAAQ
jgi:hypothetical protein